MRRIVVLLAVSSFALVLVGCTLAERTNRVLPVKDSDEIRSGTVAPESMLPPEGRALSGREFRAFNERNMTGRYKVTMEGSENGRDTAVITIARDGKRSAARVENYSFFTTATGEFIACEEFGSEVECEYADEALSSITGLTQDVLDQVTDARRTDDRVVIGLVADCVTYSFAVRGREASVETCLDRATGAMVLQITEIGSDVVVLEATALDEPNASDFDPPGIPTR